MKCDKCGAEVGATAKFCRACGQPISQVRNCSCCGQEIGPTASFCKHCGARQEAAGAPPVALPPQQVQAPANPPPSRDRVHARKESPRAKWGKGRRLAATGVVLLLGLAVFYIALDPASRPGVPGPGVTQGPSGQSERIDLGPASFKPPDVSALIETSEWGEVPASHLGVALKTGLARADAEKVAQAMGARVVGEVAYIGLYQLETAGKTEADLRAALGKARASTGVDLAFPLQHSDDDDIKGESCTLIKDKTYDGDNGKPYQMIGLDAAWNILRASGVDLSSVRVGIVDDGLYRGKGEFNGSTKFETPDKEDALSGAQRWCMDKQGNTHRYPPEQCAGREVEYGSHGTGVATVLGGDPENGGVTGVASVLGDKLTVSMVNHSSSQYDTKPTTADPKDLTKGLVGGKPYVFGSLVALKKQVESGAKVINMSWGCTDCDPDQVKAYRRFFEEMARDKKTADVLFVASAGNDGKSVDGTRREPSGLNLPNMITVGNLENDGTRVSSSNMASNNYEVTLAAPGQHVPRGIGPDGKIVNDKGGTSMAAPQVTAAAAILRSINPKLSPGDIKKLLVETAGTEVTTSGKPVQVDKSVGGRVLRVDNAVFKAINDLLVSQGKKPLDRAALEKAAPLQTLAVSKGSLDFTIQATLGGVQPKSAEVSIALNGDGSLKGLSKTKVNVPGETVWVYSKVNQSDEATLVVRRLDNGACSTIRIAGGAAPTPVPTPGGQSKDDRCAGYVPTGRNTLRDIECSMNNPGEINDVIRVDPQGFMPFEPAPGR